MRNIAASLFISIDGDVQRPDQWQFDAFNGEMVEAMQKQLAQQDAVLLGRVTYEEWAPYWPTSTNEPFATYINSTPKYIVSTTLNEVTWQNSTLVKGDVAQALTKLKQEPGQTIGVAGSPTLVEWLFDHDLLDELLLMIHPVVAGRGRRLFKDDRALKRLKLIDTQATSTGILLARYQPVR